MLRLRFFGVSFVIATAFVCLPSGCGKAPRGRDAVFTEKQRLPRVYISTTSQSRRIEPGNKGSFVDAQTKEEFWPALQCTNPACPGRTDKEPYLFSSNIAQGVAGCPACWKNRKPHTETAEQKAEYARFVQPYELPESKTARERLDEEYRQIVEADEKKRK